MTACRSFRSEDPDCRGERVQRSSTASQELSRGRRRAAEPLLSWNSSDRLTVSHPAPLTNVRLREQGML